MLLLGLTGLASLAARFGHSSTHLGEATNLMADTEDSIEEVAVVSSLAETRGGLCLQMT